MLYFQQNSVNSSKFFWPNQTAWVKSRTDPPECFSLFKSLDNQVMNGNVLALFKVPQYIGCQIQYCDKYCYIITYQGHLWQEKCISDDNKKFGWNLQKPWILDQLFSGEAMISSLIIYASKHVKCIINPLSYLCITSVFRKLDEHCHAKHGFNVNHTKRTSHFQSMIPRAPLG